jgi:hypothetical protein
MVLTYSFLRGGSTVRGEIRFETVRAARWQAEIYCTAWHTDGVYDTIAEIMDSSWLSELLDATPDHERGFWTLRHFMLYIAGEGCFEAVAASHSIHEFRGLRGGPAPRGPSR